MAFGPVTIRAQADAAAVQQLVAENRFQMGYIALMKLENFVLPELNGEDREVMQISITTSS